MYTEYVGNLSIRPPARVVTGIAIKCTDLQLFTSATFQIDLFDKERKIVDRQYHTLVGKEYTDWNSNDEYVVDKINQHVNSIHGNEMFKNKDTGIVNTIDDTFNVIADSHDNVIDNNGILDLTVPEYILYDLNNVSCGYVGVSYNLNTGDISLVGAFVVNRNNYPFSKIIDTITLTNPITTTTTIPADTDAVLYDKITYTYGAMTLTITPDTTPSIKLPQLTNMGLSYDKTFNSSIALKTPTITVISQIIDGSKKSINITGTGLGKATLNDYKIDSGNSSGTELYTTGDGDTLPSSINLIVIVTDVNGKFTPDTNTVLNPIYISDFEQSSTSIVIYGSGFSTAGLGSLASITFNSESPITTGTVTIDTKITYTGTITASITKITLTYTNGVEYYFDGTNTTNNIKPISISNIQQNDNTITINGSGFKYNNLGSLTSITFNSETPITTATVTDDTKITYTGTIPGTMSSLTLTYPNSVTYKCNCIKFNKGSITPIAATITDISYSDSKYTISGTGFESTNILKINDVSPKSADLIYSSSPMKYTYTGNITDKSSIVISNINKDINIKYKNITPITITGITNSGLVYTISGTGFSITDILKINGGTVPATYVSTTSITYTATTAIATESSIVISKTVNGITYTGSFTYITPITITGITNSGLVYTITGTGFSSTNTNTLKIDGTAVLTSDLSGVTTTSITYTATTAINTGSSILISKIVSDITYTGLFTYL